jgi:aminopeptidase-like protein
MTLDELVAKLDAEALGRQLYECVEELFPICRSITGDGVRETLRRLQRHVPLTVHEVPSGTSVFDWTVPKEWNIRDAWMTDARGERVIDFRRSNLHVLNYSVPVRGRFTLAELRPHLHTLPDHPDWIPYRTAYYQETWGFCLTDRQLAALPEGEYEVWIDASLEPGHLTYGEYYLPGQTAEEILVSCHVCHPSLANDNLSGIAVATFLARELAQCDRRYSYRFLFIPGTIGSITWLARNEARTPRIKHGLTLASLGDRGPFTYKRSRRGNAEIDHAVVHVLQHSGHPYRVADFSPYGHDERQFCSPGVNLPVGCFMRTPHSEYPEYHTSADNLDLVRAGQLADAFLTLVGIAAVLDGNARYLSRNPKCEPQLGRRGLYRSLGGPNGTQDELALLWVLNLADGGHTLLDVAERAGVPFAVIRRAADALHQHDLLEEVAADGSLVTGGSGSRPHAATASRPREPGRSS